MPCRCLVLRSKFESCGWSEVVNLNVHVEIILDVSLYLNPINYDSSYRNIRLRIKLCQSTLLVQQAICIARERILVCSLQHFPTHRRRKTFTTGTMWTSMEMLRQTYSGELVQLSSEKGEGLLSVDIRNVSIHGSADSILVGKPTL